jgi:hypothetical protein
MQPTIADVDSVIDANGGNLITDAAWYSVDNGGTLQSGIAYELWARGVSTGDVLTLTWATNSTGIAPAADEVGRALYLNSPLLVIPEAGQGRLFVRAVDSPELLTSGGFWVQLTPCE